MGDESFQAFSSRCSASRWTTARTLATFLFCLGRDACVNIQLIPDGVGIARVTLCCPPNHRGQTTAPLPSRTHIHKQNVWVCCWYLAADGEYTGTWRFTQDHITIR